MTNTLTTILHFTQSHAFPAFGSACACPTGFGIPTAFAPSASSFLNVSFRLYSMTLLFLKYSTYPPPPPPNAPISHQPLLPIFSHQGGRKPTQLPTHSFSNAADDGAHFSLAAALFLMGSMMSWRSRHWKKLSRASQHFARWLRFGATPSMAAGFMLLLLLLLLPLLLNQPIAVDVGGCGVLIGSSLVGEEEVLGGRVMTSGVA